MSGAPRLLPAAGFSLIELMVGMSVLAVLLGLALPVFSDWVRNNQVRAAAESLREGLQLARSEAVKRNTRVRLQLVSSLDASCVLSPAGPHWIVNLGASVTPSGACGVPAGSPATPFVVQASPAGAASGRVVLEAAAGGNPRAVLAFDAAGRRSATQNPTTDIAAMTIKVGSAGGPCVAAGGSVRCLQLQVSPAGEVRMCDPAQTAANDPSRC